MGRYRRSFLLILCALAFLGQMAPLLWQKSQVWFEIMLGKHSKLQEISKTSLVYRVKKGHWLDFSLPYGSPSLFVVVNAHLDPQIEDAPDLSWHYAIRYQLLDAHDHVLVEDMYHQKSRLSRYQVGEDQIYPATYYLNGKARPLDGRAFTLSTHVSQASRLRLQMVSLQPGVDEAAVRVYMPARIADSRLAAAWLRMTESQRNELATGSVYSADLLTEAEKINLIKHQLQPIGPNGVEGTDYQTKLLYTWSDVEWEKIGDMSAFSGLQADRQHPAVIPLPEQGGKLRLRFNTLQGQDVTQPLAVNLQWFGRLKQTWQLNTTWTRDAAEVAYPVQGGLLEIRPDKAVVVRAELEDDQGRQDITPSPLSIKTYRTDLGVDFSILHIDQRMTPVRVDIRKILTDLNESSPADLNYQWLDDKKQVVQEGKLSINPVTSAYDSVPVWQAPPITDPISYYFNLPSRVRQVYFKSNDTNILVSVYNQPSDMLKIQKVPEDAYFADHKQNTPSWFPLRPTNEQFLTMQLKLQWINGQYRPPESDPDIDNGIYAWEEYQPEQHVNAQLILSPSTGEVRKQALLSAFCPIKPNRFLQVDLQHPGAVRAFSPELVYRRQSEQPFTLSLIVDGKLSAEWSLAGKQGVLRLPEMDIGGHEVGLHADRFDGQWWLNGVANCAQSYLIKRKVFQLREQPLTFLFNHQQNADERLSVRWYVNSQSDQRTQIKVQIERLDGQAGKILKVAKAWTFQNRLYDIRSVQGEPTRVLYSNMHTLNKGESFFIPINNDMQAGLYQVSLNVVEGEAGYLALSQLKPGHYEQRHIYWETAFNAH